MSILQISTLLVAAAASGLVAKLLKQPLLIGYLFAGLVFSILGLTQEKEALEAMGQIGVTLLLFLVGLEMNFHEIKTVGKAALVTGLGQIIFTSLIGFFIARFLGFSDLSSLYIAIALTFSSTIIIIKLLSEKNDLDTLYGKVAVGFLLVQDFVAILILMFLAGLGRGENLAPLDFLFVIVKALVLILAIIYLSKKVIPNLFEKFATGSSELVFIVSIAWALGLASLVAGPLGFTYEVGGFLAGIALSNISEQLQIISKTRPIRDFFLIIFFFILGTKLMVGGIGALLVPAVIFSLFVLIGNPLIVLILMGILGYKKKTSFLASVTVAQISEFSLILMAMGLTVAHVTQNDVSIVILVGVITMTLSTYMILSSEKIFAKLSTVLGIFERKNTHELILPQLEKLYDHVVLIGAGRTGMNLINYLRKHKLSFTVIDFNPDLTSRLASRNYPVIFGDMTDMEILESANVSEARAIISTTPNFSDNLALLKLLKKFGKKATVILEASSQANAKQLYKNGADYVILPTHLTGEHLRAIAKQNDFSKIKLQKMGISHIKRLGKT